MPQITLHTVDAAELAETLAFLASWLSGSQKRVLAGSLAAFVGQAGPMGSHLDQHAVLAQHPRSVV
jgi:hypothetical protein